MGADRGRSRARRPPTRPRPSRRRTIRTRSSSPRPSAPRRVQDVPFSINAQTAGRHPARQCLDDRGHQPQRRRPDRAEPRAGPEPGVDPRRVRRADRPRPAGRQGTGRRLSRRKRHLAVAVHARFRPVRPQPRRDAARAAGHVVRVGQRRRHDSLHHQPAASWADRRASIEANVNTVDEGDIGGHVKAAINVPLGDTAALRAVGYGTNYAGFIDAVGPAGGKNVNDGSRVGGRISLLWEPTAEHQHHAARGLPGDPRRRLQPRGSVQSLRQPVHRPPPAT